VKPGTIEWFRWFYRDIHEPEGIAERWHEDLVINQSPEMVGTAGTFHACSATSSPSAGRKPSAWTSTSI
jgi:hypothetical protein